MTVNKLYAELDKKIPRALSCSWDNDGAMCIPNGEREVKKVLVALDVTEAVVEHAAENGYDLIVSHHPLIFKGLKGITEQNNISRKAIRLIGAGISVFSFHTRLDALEGGVNDKLCEVLGIKDTTPFGNAGEEIGRIGTLDGFETAEELAAFVKERLGCGAVFLSDAKIKPCRVAVLGGSGSDDVMAAVCSGADTYISGEIKHSYMTEAPENNINIIAAGHFFTEQPVCEVLCEMIRSIDSSIECEIFWSDAVKTV